ncbi:MAG: hypothetical protein M0Q53_03630 [Prolixibacteraceae bacterium]|jgi:hypothetical protein|nr:hypothetical protein [Prolixibacteraceae bacterium]
MKRLMICMVMTFMVLSLIPAQLSAANEMKAKSELLTVAKTESPALAVSNDLAVYNAQMARLEEIKAMDMSTLNRSEKKVLRTEVKAIKNDQDERSRRYRDRGDRDNYDNGRHGGTVFIYGGGGLLLILLIILLL